jgi:hypothetical protein
VSQHYLVINRHEPDQCGPMDAGINRIGDHLKGKDFHCTCPFGEHGFYMILEGESAEDVVNGLPPEWRPGTRAIGIETFKLPTD